MTNLNGKFMVSSSTERAIRNFTSDIKNPVERAEFENKLRELPAEVQDRILLLAEERLTSSQFIALAKRANIFQADDELDFLYDFLKNDPKGENMMMFFIRTRID